MATDTFSTYGKSSMRAGSGALVLADAAGLALLYRHAVRRLGVWPNAVTGGLAGALHGLGAMAVLASGSEPRATLPGTGRRDLAPGAFWLLAAPVVLGHALGGALLGWTMERPGRRDLYVSPAFLRWLRRQEDADHVEAHPTPIQPRLRVVPANDPAPARAPATPVWTLPRAA